VAGKPIWIRRLDKSKINKPVPMTTSNNSRTTPQIASPLQFDGNHTVHRLDDITAQLAQLNDEPVGDAAEGSSRPEVVFIDGTENLPQQTIVVTLSDSAPVESIQQALNGSSVQDASSLEQPAEVDDAEISAGDWGREFHHYREPIQCDPTSDGRLVVDPFTYEDSGEMPTMTSLPVLEAERMTQDTVARQTSGEHHAWTLASELDQATSAESSVAAKGQPELADRKSGSQAADQPLDCFFAEPGQVIFVDGNLGFDHIDVRSYSIEHATFQPGSIVLHSNLDPSALAEGEQLAAPITIRYQGVKFAVFSDDVTVEL
jgi:hypothetical protein